MQKLRQHPHIPRTLLAHNTRSYYIRRHSRMLHYSWSNNLGIVGLCLTLSAMALFSIPTATLCLFSYLLIRRAASVDQLRSTPVPFRSATCPKTIYHGQTKPQTPGHFYASSTMEQLAFIANNSIDISKAILLDTGCSQHIFHRQDDFHHITLFEPHEKPRINGIGNTCLQPIGYGEVDLILNVQGQRRSLTLTNVLFCPELNANLISGSQLLNHDAEISLTKNGCFIFDSTSTIVAEAFLQYGVVIIHT
jgi:hypothetical protein